MKKLTPQPARTDLTDRECSNLLGAIIGGLCLMSNKRTVRDAVRWWAECDQAWDMMPNNEQVMEAAYNMVTGSPKQ